MATAVERLIGSLHRGAAHATIGTQIVYRLFISSKLNPATGKTVDVYRDVPIRDAVHTRTDAREIIAGGPLQVGDVGFEFPSAWLEAEVGFVPAKALSTSDRIVHEGTSYRVIVWSDSGVIVKVTVRR